MEAKLYIELKDGDASGCSHLGSRSTGQNTELLPDPIINIAAPDDCNLSFGKAFRQVAKAHKVDLRWVCYDIVEAV